ncbi:MAG: hypothetical protein JWO77_312 [Ilumatobacteraceae bacterium]|nr:hypothetical protein [Ilumatobacteraceae bacterium]
MIGHERTGAAVAEGRPPVTGGPSGARDHRAVDGPIELERARAPRSAVAGLWAAPLVVHLLVLVAVLVGVAAATSQPDSFTTDEGSYEIQLRALEQGSWAWDSGTEQLDPAGTHHPVAYATQTADGWVPLAKHPLWPWAAAQAAKAVGTTHAYDVLGSVAVLIAALAAWMLAAVRDPRLSRRAFWIAGLAPVTVTATFGWAHAAAAAAAGVAVLGAVLLVQRGARSPWGTAAAGALVAGGVGVGILVRTEGLLLALALAVALVVGGRRADRSWAWSAGSAAAVVAWSAVVLKAEDLWVQSIIGSGSTTLTARSGGGVRTSGFIDARLQGAVRSLFDVEGRVLAVVVVLAIVGAAVTAGLAARGDRRWLPRWHVAMVVLVMAFVLRTVSLVDEPVRGIVIAWPILLVGLAAAGSWLWRRLALETVVAVLYLGAILATQYPDGGAVQWGGRFYAPLTVPLAVMAALGVRRILAVEDAERSTSAAPASVSLGRVLTVAAVVLPLVLGTWLCASIRTFMSTTYTGVDARIEGVAVTPDPQLPRMMWRYRQPWLVVQETDHGADLAATLGALRSRPDGPDQVSLVLRDYDLVHARSALAALGGAGHWTEVGRSEVNGLTVINLER